MYEQEIIRLIRERDERGAGELLRHYGPLMRYIIAPILPNAQDQEECLSEAVMLVWSRIDAYDPQRGKWATWLTALTRNTALNRARKSAFQTEELSQRLPAEGQSPEDILLRQEQLSALRSAIGRLPRQERALIYRKYYYRQSTAQIACELGMSERAVEGRLYRTKKKLRHILGGDIHDGMGF